MNELKKDLETFELLHKEYENAIKYIGFETIVGDLIVNLLDDNAELLARIYEPEEEYKDSWIYWFIWENKMGEDKLTASLDGKEYIIDDIDSFCTFMDILENS